MSADYKKDHKNHRMIEPFQEEDDDAGSGSDGKSGQIAFKDFSVGDQSLRDDALSPESTKRLLAVHQHMHEARVKKQKDLRAQRALVKSGDIPLQTYKQGMMETGMNAQYRQHPILADKVQFSGIDRQETPLSTEQVSATNEANRDELELQYRLRYAPEQTPRFNPKPQYR
jgi:hypothetical protein